MKKLLLVLIVFLSGCSNKSPKYLDIITSESDIQYYELNERTIEDDNGTSIEIKIPDYLIEYNSEKPENVASFGILNDEIKMMVSINKLESRSSLKFSNKQIVDATYDEFINNWNSDLKKIEELMPQGIYNNLQIASFSALKIDNKYFLERVSYYNDSRLINTELEGLQSLEYYYSTHHKGRQYTTSVVFYGEYTIASFIGLARSIAGTIKFLN